MLVSNKTLTMLLHAVIKRLLPMAFPSLVIRFMVMLQPSAEAEELRLTQTVTGSPSGTELVLYISRVPAAD